MVYNLDKHHRRSIRLKSYDYSAAGIYFITICTYQKEYYFEMYPMLSNIVQNEWENIPNRFPNVSLDEFVIMPNHVHGIIIIGSQPVVGATLAVARDVDAVARDFKNRAGASPAPTVATLGNIVGSFKSLCTKSWLEYIRTHKMDIYGKIWQRNYYDHIIRNKKELKTVREYIRTNQDNWLNDEYYQKEND